MNAMLKTETEWHPAACIFPMLPDDELQALAADIREHGLREPVVFFEGKVLDGRNRWLACKFAGVEPKITEFVGSRLEALNLVWSVNRHRRHLSSSQSAACYVDYEKQIAVEIESIRKEKAKRPTAGRPKKNSVQIVEPNKKDNSLLVDHSIAQANGTNRTYVAGARSVEKARPDLHEQVKAGKMTIPQAKTEIKRDEKRKALKTKAEEVKEAFVDQPLWTLINQDVMDGLQSVIDHHGPARLVFADPPYNIGIKYGDHHDDDVDDAKFIDWCLQWTRLACDCLTDDGSLWLMINDEYAADFVANCRDCGLTMRAWIKWYESFGVNCSNNFNRTSRHILYFVMDPDNFVFNETEVLRPSDRQSKYNDSRAQSSGKILDDVWFDIPRLAGTAKERIPDFPTQLPVELLSRIVRCASEPGDLIVDPFNGSGTTGVAALRNDRTYIGIDASEKFIDLAHKRLMLEGCNAVC